MAESSVTHSMRACRFASFRAGAYNIPPPMVITIDGPAGTGKSTTARALAERLGFDFLDTGAMYRAVTLAALRAGIDLHEEDALRGLLAGLQLEVSAGKVILNGEDVTRLIRSSAVTAASGAI